MSAELSTEQKLAILFREVWDAFVVDGEMDGSTLQEAIEKTGLVEWRSYTVHDGQVFDDAYIEEGNPMLFPTEEGKRVLSAARRVSAG